MTTGEAGLSGVKECLSELKNLVGVNAEGLLTLDERPEKHEGVCEAGALNNPYLGTGDDPEKYR